MQVITGVALFGPFAQPDSFFVETTVKFRQVDEPVLQQYVDTGEGLDKAGGYGIQVSVGCAL